MEKVYFFSKWWLLYLAIAILASLLILVIILFPLGISIGSDLVFGFTAMISFLISEVCFKKVLKKELLISSQLQYSVLYALIPICLFVMLFGLS